MSRFEIPDSTSPQTVADWVEFEICLNSYELAKSETSAYMEASFGYDLGDDRVDSVWLELERRITLYGDKPPFRVNGNVVECCIDWHAYPEYMACLIFSLVGNAVEPLESGKLFERISGVAMKHYLPGQSLLPGFPDHLSAKAIAESLNERFIREPLPTSKDRKLDLIAWKSFNDCRCSQIVVLIQCASGHDWKQKVAQPNVDAWCKYIQFGCRPIKGFALPLLLSDPEVFEDVSADGGLIIDRARIYRSIVASSPDESLKGDVRCWCNLRITDIGG